MQELVARSLGGRAHSGLAIRMQAGSDLVINPVLTSMTLPKGNNREGLTIDSLDVNYRSKVSGIWPGADLIRPDAVGVCWRRCLDGRCGSRPSRENERPNDR